MRSGLCVQFPLHRFEQQLGVLLQKSQGFLPLSPLTPDLWLHTLWGGVGERVQLSSGCQQGLGQDVPHLVLILAGLLQHLV